MPDVAVKQAGENKTVYKIASSPADFRRAHAFMAAEGMEWQRLSNPLVYAERDGDIIGLLGITRTRDRLWFVGPLVVAKAIRSPGRIVMRMADIFDAVMRRIGVHSYEFAVEAGNASWLEQVRRSGLADEVSEENGLVWFKRAL